MNRSVHYFTFAQKLLSFAGLWHTQTHRQRLFRYFIISLASLHCVFGQLCQLYTSNFDLGTAVRLLQIFIPTICAIIMYCTCILNFKTLQKIYSYILYDTRLLNDDIEIKIVQRFVNYSNMFSIVAIVTLNSFIIVNVASSLLRIIFFTNEIRSDLDLYPIISCFDYFSNRETYYYPIIMYQVVTIVALIMAAVACYTNLFIFILHALARLCITQYKIYSPFLSNNRDDVPVRPVDLSLWIIDIIKRLTRTRKFMTLVNTVFEKSYLFQMSLGMCAIILDFLCVPVLLTHEAVMKDVLSIIIFVSGTLAFLYLHCYLGQRLMDRSAHIYIEACLVPFHKMSLKTQQLLLMTLMVCAKPYTFSIGKVYVASHEFFSNLLRTSLSFAMVVHSLENV